MKFIKTKKGLALLAVIAVVAISAVGAYAYFSSTGHGSGTAGVGSVTADSIAVTSSTSGALYPLSVAPAANTSITVTNNDTVAEHVNQVTETGIAVTNSGADPGECNPAWFEFDGSPITVDAELAASGGHVTLPAAATVWLVDDGQPDQDGCQGQTVTVSYTSN